jgi:hypothetical protein
MDVEKDFSSVEKMYREADSNGVDNFTVKSIFEKEKVIFQNWP